MTSFVFRFGLSGLHCGACVGRAEAALGALPGAHSVRVNLAAQSAQVGGVAAQDVVRALADAGYPAEPMRLTLHLPDMHCASCVGRIEAVARAQPGVVSAQANLAGRTLEVELLGPLAAGEDGLKSALTAAGYAPETVLSTSETEARGGATIAALRRAFVLSAALTAPVFFMEMGGHLYPPLHHALMQLLGHGTLAWVQLVLTLAVLAGPGRGFFLRGVPGLARARPDMDALVALGAGAAFLFSAVVTVAPGLLPSRAIYFEAACVIVTLILLGRWLEARARGRTGDAVRQLLELAPDQALRLGPGGVETVPVAAIAVGDVLVAKPGTRIAVDGVVTQGQSPVDTAMLTGEPVPRVAGPGDEVHAGTVLTTGSFEYRATHVGRDTALARIAELTRAAQATRLPVEALVTRITAWFVPAVLVLATVTFVIWWALAGLGPAVVSAVSVLIIACPCAMGLATPMSIMVGTGRAARLGVLFHKGAALQRLQDVRVVAFDKTGTLTEGKLAVSDIALSGGVARTDLLRLVAGVEAVSEHPIAAALVAAWEGAVPAAQDFEAVPGAGAAASVEGRVVVVGTAQHLEARAVALSAELIAQAAAWAEAGATPVHVAVDGAHVAALAVNDTIRPMAARAVSRLHALGRHVALLSGDVTPAARHVGAQLDVDSVVAEVRPEGKVDAIRALRTAHGPVAFVGDGINDAPALAAADVGLAVGGATDIAVEAADVVLLSSDPQAVVTAMGISRAVLRNVWQNLGWAFCYNVALIPVAAGVLVPFGGPQLSPQLAALAMALSSLFVVSNALRLRRWELG